MKNLATTLLAMSIFSLFAKADTNAVASLQTDAFEAPNGKSVAFTCIKHGSLRIRYDGLEIQIDPVGKGLKPQTDYAQFPKADLVLVTHEHFDHFDAAAIAALRKDGTAVYANPAVHGMLGFGDALENGGSATVRDDVTIEAVPAYNTTPGREKFHPKGRDNGYVLSLGGFRVYLAGDTEDIPEMADVKDIDVAFLPVNQPYTMTPEQAAAAAKIVGPKVLFPYHYSQTPIRKVADLLAGAGIDVRIRDYR